MEPVKYQTPARTSESISSIEKPQVKSKDQRIKSIFEKLGPFVELFKSDDPLDNQIRDLKKLIDLHQKGDTDNLEKIKAQAMKIRSAVKVAKSQGKTASELQDLNKNLGQLIKAIDAEISQRGENVKLRASLENDLRLLSEVRSRPRSRLGKEMGAIVERTLPSLENLSAMDTLTLTRTLKQIREDILKNHELEGKRVSGPLIKVMKESGKHIQEFEKSHVILEIKPFAQIVEEQVTPQKLEEQIAEGRAEISKNLKKAIVNSYAFGDKVLSNSLGYWWKEKSDQNQTLARLRDDVPLKKLYLGGSTFDYKDKRLKDLTNTEFTQVVELALNLIQFGFTQAGLGRKIPEEGNLKKLYESVNKLSKQLSPEGESF